MLEERIFSILNKLEGQVGLYFEDLQDGEKITINAERVFPAASTIKIPLISLLLKKISKGVVGLDDVVSIDKNNRVAGTGIIKELNKNFKPTILDLATLSIVVSDNVATNQIIDLVGGPLEVTEFCYENGLLDTKLQRKMLDIEAMKEGRDNITTAKDMGKLLGKLVRHEFVSEDLSKALIDIMKSQQYRHKLPALLPAVESYDPSVCNDEILPGTVLIANKTGSLWKVQNDVGIFILPGNKTYVISMFTNKLSEDSEGIRTISEVSKAIYDEMVKK